MKKKKQSLFDKENEFPVEDFELSPIHEEGKLWIGETVLNIYNDWQIEMEVGRDKYIVRSETKEEAEANAALIAEAKNMYLALKDVYAWLPAEGRRNKNIMKNIGEIISRIK